jgi:hypothetical protein
MRGILTTAAAALLAARVWAGDQRPAPTPQAAPVARPAAPSSPVRTAPKATQARLPDAQLEAAIRAKFAKSKCGPDKFSVRVQGGVATIEGKTEIVQHKGSATRMAKTAGAISVNNHILVSDAAKQKAAGNLEEGRRRAQIKRGDTRGSPRQQAAPPAVQTPAQRKNP